MTVVPVVLVVPEFVAVVVTHVVTVEVPEIVTVVVVVVVATLWAFTATVPDW